MYSVLYSIKLNIEDSLVENFPGDHVSLSAVGRGRFPKGDTIPW